MGTGVPAATPPTPVVTFSTEWVALGSATDAVASVAVSTNRETQTMTVRLRLETAGWRVDDLLISVFDLLRSLAEEP